MRAAVVDTVASIVFFSIVAGLTEYFVAGLSPTQVLVSRSVTIPVLVLTGRPYGMWRDLVFALTGARRRGRPALLALDTVAFMTFQLPVYAAILALAGATGPQMLAALASATFAMLLLSRPFGVFLDWVRQRSGTAPQKPL